MFTKPLDRKVKRLMMRAWQ